MVNINIFKKLNYFNLDITFNAHREVLVIQGPSGSGKTTILNCIAGINTPDRGKIVIGDRKVFSFCDNINLPIKDRNIGYVFQNYALFPHMTVKENIHFGLVSRGIKDFSYARYIEEILKIEHLKNRFPSEISGGEKQRVALARALVTKPKLLLFDEPFSALDSDTRNVIYKEFLEFKEKIKMDIILITHNNNEAQLLGDRSISIKQGVIEQLV